LQIYAEDTLNIFALPYPSYDSNKGFGFSIKTRDYNFLGRMQEQFIDIGYDLDTEKRNFFWFDLDTGLPFHLFGFKWFLNFDNYYLFRMNMEEKHFYKNLTGLSIDIPVKRTTLTIGFNERLLLNEENTDLEKAIYQLNDDFQEGFYMSSNPFIKWKIPTGIFVDNFSEILITTEISAVFNHPLSTKLTDNRVGPFLKFTNNINFGRINWIGNFKKGFSADINNTSTIDFHDKKHPLTFDIKFSGITHFIFNEYVGHSIRLMYRHWFYTYHNEAGDALRGIADKLDADFMFSLNLDFPIKVLKIRPSKWFKNEKWRFFNFDIHLNPVIDIAVYNYLQKQSSFNIDNFLFSGGFEIIIFPEFIRNLFLRVSMCCNFLKIKDIKNNYEIFFGVELHY